MRYGIKRRLRSGDKVKIYPTFRCNLSCSYCGNKLEGNKRPSIKNEYDLYDWMEFFERYPRKIKEVHISGGEPTVYEDFVYLIHYLINKGYLVTVLTNLKKDIWYRVDGSCNLFILATYHARSNYKDTFENNYNNIKKYHRIVAKEIESNVFTFTKKEKWGCTIDSAKTVAKDYYYVGPDGKVFESCYDIIENYK